MNFIKTIKLSTRIKANFNTNSSLRNNNIKTTNLSREINKIKLEEKYINKNTKNNLQDLNSKSNVKLIKSTLDRNEEEKESLKEVIYYKKDNKKENIYKEKEMKKHNYIRNKQDLILNKKDLNILTTNFNFSNYFSPKIKKSFSLKNKEFNENLILKHLSNKKEEIQSKLSQLNRHKIYLKEESLSNIQIPNFKTNNSQFKVINNLDKQKENLLEKISFISQQIYSINENQKNNSSLNENSKEDYSENIRKRFIFNNNFIQKDNIKIDFKKKIRNQKLINQQNLKNESKDISKNNRNKKEENNLSNKKHKSFINNIIKPNKKSGYLYKKMTNSFDEKEQNYIKEKLKSKIYDIKKLSKLDIKYNSLKKKIIKLEKLDNLHKLWKERSELLPKYVSPLFKNIISSEENEKKNEKDKIEKRKLLYTLKQNYGKEKVNFPPISLILRKEWNKKNNKFNLGKSRGFNSIIKNDLNSIKLIQLQKTRNNSSKKEKNTSIINEKIIKRNKLNNLIINNDTKIKNSYSFIIDNNKLNLNNINLSRNESQEINSIKKIKSIKYKKILNQNDIDKDINNIKYQIERIETKYKRGKELLKLKGGYINNENFGDEVNELLINSIKGKLVLIEKSNS